MPKFTSKSIKSRLGFHSKDEETEEMDWKYNRQKMSFKFINQFKSPMNFSNNHNNNNNNHDDGDDDDNNDDGNVGDGNVRSKRSLSLFTKKKWLKTEPYGVSDRPKSSAWNRQDIPSDPNWYQIILPGVHKFDKKLIIDALSDYMKPHTFVPIMYKIINQKAVFYVDNEQAAENLLRCHNKIIIDNYFSINVDINILTRFPSSEFDDVFKTRIRLAMSNRYVEETKSLDLSCFHHDPNLVDDYFCGLFRPDILIHVLEIASEAVPHLEALNLDNNKLSKLEKLTVLSTSFKSLKILYLANNKIKYESNLNVLRDLQLEELHLEGNEFIDKLQKMNLNYSSVIRKKFPTLVRLDGKPLPKMIRFDIEDVTSISLPATVKIFTTNQQTLNIAQEFVKLYFNIYDSSSRQPLLNAYLDNAVFTMTIDPKATIDLNSAWASGNRNLLYTKNFKRVKLLNTGRLHIVSCLSGLPKTQHLADSLTLDVKALTDSMMIITVTGLFKELGSDRDILRHFCRTFIVERFGTGYCIGNEQFHIADATVSQVKLVQHLLTKAPNIGLAGSQNGVENIELTVTEDTTQLPESIKEQMTQALSERTKMKHEWSYKCLSEVNWIYDVAIRAFEEHNKRGSIPPEAFG